MTGELENALISAGRWLEVLSIDGPDLTVHADKKAVHEAEELLANPSEEEAADVFICLMGVAVREGWTVKGLAYAIEQKVATNRARTWYQKPDGTWQHI